MENWNWTKLLLLFSFIIFLGSLLLRQESAITQDLGRHLRLGEMIVAGEETRKCALYSNCLTYTYPDYPFINHHWGSEVIFYLIHKVGGFPALIIFKAIVLGLAFGVTVLHTVSRGPSTNRRTVLYVTAITITFFAIQMMADRLTTRPEIFGYLFFSLLFWLLDAKTIRPSLLIISSSLLILLWTNLHISFIFGLILIWIWTGSQILNTEFQILNEKTVKAKLPSIQNSVFRIQYLKFLAAATISTLITLLNPSGLRGALMPLSILKDYGYTIVENMTPYFLSAFKPQPEYWIYSILLIITIVLFLFSSARKNPFCLLTFITFSLFPLIAVRHLPFFALIIPPVLTPLLFSVLKGPALQGKAGPYPILTTGCLFLAALINPIPLAYGKLSPIGLTIDSRHDQAIEFVKQNNLQGPMWNNYDIGSFLEWALPKQPTFVDGRPEAFPVEFFRQTYIPMQENKEVWDRVAAGYDIQWIFAALTDSTPWFVKWWKMIQAHQDWRIVYFDNFSAVLVKTGGINDSVQPQGKARLLNSAGLD